MRLIDADALEELFREVIGGIAKNSEMNGNLEHMVRASAMVIEMIQDAPTIEPEPQIIYSKAGYIMSLHKEYGCTLTRAEEAHNKALEYLRDKAMMKG